MRSPLFMGDQKWIFTALSECNIVEDMGSLTDTCELKLPRNIRWQGQVAPAGNNKEMIYPPSIVILLTNLNILVLLYLFYFVRLIG